MRTTLYAIGVRIPTPLGFGVVRSIRASRRDAGTMLYEVQLDTESCIRTWTEDELATTSQPALTRRPLVPRPILHARWVTGESVSTPEGEGIIRNLLQDVYGVHHAIVQLIGTSQYREIACADLSPPLEAA